MDMRITIFFLFFLCCCRQPTTDFVIENQTNYKLEIRAYNTTYDDMGDTLIIGRKENFVVNRIRGESSDNRRFFNILNEGPDSVRVEFNSSKYLLLECYEDFSDCSFEKCDVCISNLVYGSPSNVVIITEDHYNSAIPF